MAGEVLATATTCNGVTVTWTATGVANLNENVSRRNVAPTSCDYVFEGQAARGAPIAVTYEFPTQTGTRYDAWVAQMVAGSMPPSTTFRAQADCTTTGGRTPDAACAAGKLTLSASYLNADSLPPGVNPFLRGDITFALNRFAGSVTNSFSITVMADDTSAPTFPLTVSRAGTGTGTVTSSPAGINCGSSCSATFASGTSVTLSAAPATGSSFTGWSGACSGTGACTVALTAAASVTANFTASSAPSNGTALWWNPAESGWGINLNQQGTIVFATLFTYDSTGAPLWLVMSNGAVQADGVTYTGQLYRTTGPAFNANPFTPIDASNLSLVGTMSIRIVDASTATLTYTFNGVSVTKTIQKQLFGTRLPNCTSGATNRASATNYQDLWWNPAESGWGVNVTHQDNTLFATLFTYDAAGKGLWLVMSAGQRQADGSYLGDLLRTTGPAFNANPFVPIGAANVTTVGTMRFQFTNGENGTLTYTYNGTAVTKSITRQVFSSPVPSCN